MINKARLKQRSLVITLLDLRNAFGEVHHNLIPEVLQHHHIPSHIQTIIDNLYFNFHTSIVTNSFRTPFIKVSWGVLQGDCLSPLTFKLCFNTFIKYISDPKFNQFGFSTSSLNPLHWFQFADDAAVITSLENENQILLNHFSRWYTWEDMILRVDKCSSFGMKKSLTSSLQFLHKLIWFQLSNLEIHLNILVDISPLIWIILNISVFFWTPSMTYHIKLIISLAILKLTFTLSSFYSL